VRNSKILENLTAVPVARSRVKITEASGGIWNIGMHVMLVIAITLCLLTIVQPLIMVDNISHFDHIKLLGQLKPSFADIMFMRSSTNIHHLVFIHQLHCQCGKILIYFVRIGWMFLNFRANGQKDYLHISDFDSKIVPFQELFPF
jgi:hypothetical protein